MVITLTITITTIYLVTEHGYVYHDMIFTRVEVLNEQVELNRQGLLFVAVKAEIPN